MQLCFYQTMNQDVDELRQRLIESQWTTSVINDDRWHWVVSATHQTVQKYERLNVSTFNNREGYVLVTVCVKCVCVWMHKITQKQPWLDFDEVFSVVITWDDNKSMKFWASVPTGETPGWLTFDMLRSQRLTWEWSSLVRHASGRRGRFSVVDCHAKRYPAAVAESPCWHCSALGFNKCSSSC